MPRGWTRTAVAVGVVGSGLAIVAGFPIVGYTLLLGSLGVLIFATELSPNVLIAGASVTAIALGAWDESGIEEIRVVGKIFIALLKMLVAPMILLSITSGIAGMANARDFGRIGTRTLWFYIGTMTLAVGTGLVFVNVFEPGAGSDLRTTDFFAGALARSEAPAAAPELSLGSSLGKMVTDAFANPVAALAQGRILPIVAFAVMLGLALVRIGEAGRPLIDVLAAANAAVMQMIGWFVKLAPIGVFALMGHLVATAGIALLVHHLGLFIAVVFGATVVHAGVTLPLIVRTFGGVSPGNFLRGIQPALWVAFSTSSSAATLPVTTKCVEEELGVPREVASFVLPLGATVNMDGTALYEAIAALFIANIYEIDLGLGSQLIVFLISMVSAIGAPGIPSAGMVTMIVVLESVGLPLEGVALLLTIDRVLDTVRTMANVEGDAAVALCVARAR